jgi:hypothetical protein
MFEADGSMRKKDRARSDRCLELDTKHAGKVARLSGVHSRSTCSDLSRALRGFAAPLDGRAGAAAAALVGGLLITRFSFDANVFGCVPDASVQAFERLVNFGSPHLYVVFESADPSGGWRVVIACRGICARRLRSNRWTPAVEEGD